MDDTMKPGSVIELQHPQEFKESDLERMLEKLETVANDLPQKQAYALLDAVKPLLGLTAAYGQCAAANDDIVIAKSYINRTADAVTRFHKLVEKYS